MFVAPITSNYFSGRVHSPAARVAIRTTDDAPPPTDKLRYLHRDHLGSVDTITDAAGAVVERLSYGAFGKRRTAAGANAWTDPALAIAAVNTPRGFTGHEHLDDFQLVHMNGRVYDPSLGRFMSADPFVQFPESTQGLNRYSYAANNPLSFTDPSGYFIGKLFKAVGRFFRKILSVPIFRTIANVAIGIYCGPAAPVCIAKGSALLAAAGGGDLGDIFKAAAIAYVSAEAFHAVGQKFGSPEFLSPRHLVKTLAHGTVGGVMSAASGGRFQDGFLGSAAGQLGAPAIDGIGGDGAGGTSARVIAAAVVGGTASKLGGGKFANGAITAAFGRLYNEEGDLLDEVLPADSFKVDPEFRDELQPLVDAGIAASEEVSGWFGLKPEWLRGIHVHVEFKRRVDALGGRYYSEVSYRDGFEARYGQTGSVRADAIFGSLSHPKFSVDLKTGSAYVSRAAFSRYRQHLPHGTPVIQLNVP